MRSLGQSNAASFGAREGWKRRSLVAHGAFFAVAVMLLLGVFNAAEWYAERVALPRYCDDPEAAVRMVDRILTQREPAQRAETRPYVIAAKLLYLVPRRDRETHDAYIGRLSLEIAQRCR